jgi:long-chain acyl-CoA synthetase
VILVALYDPAIGGRDVQVRSGYSGDLSWPLARAAAVYPGSVAVIDRDRCVDYRELARRVAALDAGLSALGVEAAARVGFLGVNSLAHLECWLGVPAAGRVLVDLNFRLSDRELAFMVDDCEIELLIADREQHGRARELAERCPSLRLVLRDAEGYEELLAAGSATAAGRDRRTELELADETLAAISYTGGTTGAPKGVMLTHGNLLANARHNLIATGHSPGDRWLHVCPMFHVAGIANVFACTWVGASQIVLPRFDAAAVAETIERERITHVVLVPTMLAMLLDHLESEGERDLSSLRHIQYAASPITPALQRRVLERFDREVVQFYGMTEAAPTVSCCTAEDHRRGVAGEEPYATRLRSIGAPVVGVQAEVRGPDGSQLAPGSVGEVWVRGPNVMPGYWNRPDATEAVLQDGWYRSGDAAYADADGYMYLVDRLKDMIISGGENVYSIEVESVLAEHDAVVEAAAFGIPDPRWGEAVHAVVSVRPGVTVAPEELIAHCRGRIAGYKIPRSIEVREEPLPKSGAGKLLKHVLREPYWAGQDRRVS